LVNSPEKLQDVIMTEEQELKLMVKDVAKKLTYEEEEKYEQK